MADDVGQRLLGNAVGGEVERCGQHHRQALRNDADIQARGPGGGDQVRELAEPRRRPPRRSVAGLAQHVERGAQLPQRLPACVLDGRQRGAGLLRQFAVDVKRDACLDVDEGDVVGEDIVQLPGDAQALVARLQLFLLLLQPRGFGGPEPADPDPLAHAEQDEQPRRQGGHRAEGRTGPAPQQIVQPREGQEPPGRCEGTRKAVAL